MSPTFGQVFRSNPAFDSRFKAGSPSPGSSGISRPQLEAVPPGESLAAEHRPGLALAATELRDALCISTPMYRAKV